MKGPDGFVQADRDAGRSHVPKLRTKAGAAVSAARKASSNR
jgi:hypothetical protein